MVCITLMIKFCSHIISLKFLEMLPLGVANSLLYEEKRGILKSIDSTVVPSVGILAKFFL